MRVMDRLKIMAAENPGRLSVLIPTWKTHSRDYRAAEVLYQQVLAQPDTEPRKQSALRYLEQRGAQLQAMLGSRQVIRNVRTEIRKRAELKLPPLDPIASTDHDMVAMAVREAHSGDIPEPKPNFAIMDDRTFRDYTKRHYGF